MENQLPPASDKDISNLEKRLGIPLPPSYKRFLRCARGFTALGGAVQMGLEHPFFHPADGVDTLITGEPITSASHNQGMLCFAEFFMESDGDQVLFDVKHPGKNGEYPVYYYHHEGIPHTRKLADSFEQWLNEFPDYMESDE